MKNFEIDTENNIRVLDSGQVSTSDATFASEQELRRISAGWPASRLVDMWNKLPGVTPVRKFTDRKTACARIWKRLPTREAAVGPRRPTAAPEAAGARQKADKGQKRATARQGGKKAGAGRQGSKKAKILALLERPDGASLQELMAATGWQAHSVRGFISGHVGKKMDLKVESYKRNGETRAYRISGN